MTTPATVAVKYPDSDGMPLPDGEFQSPLYVNAVGTLRVHFRNVKGSRVNGDNFIYYVEGNPRRSVAPDCYVALNLSEESIASIERHNTYLIWEVGKVPDFFLEIASESAASNDTGPKRDLYADIGVSEYWRYDATGGDFYGEPLVGERLVDGEYRRLSIFAEADGRIWGHSDILNLDLWWIDGELRFWDPAAEQWLLTQEEEHDGRLTAEARVVQLEAELRKMRGE